MRKEGRPRWGGGRGWRLALEEVEEEEKKQEEEEEKLIWYCKELESFTIGHLMLMFFTLFKEERRPWSSIILHPFLLFLLLLTVCSRQLQA